MTEKQLEKSITDYYACLLKTDNKFKILIESSQRPLNSLKNQVEQLKLVSDHNLDKADVCETDPEFRGKLIFKINVAIEDEISLISEIVSQLNNANQVLQNKFEKLETARCGADPDSAEMRSLIIGTPHKPRLDLLMQWAVDSSRYYNGLNSTINRCLKSLDCKKEETIFSLIESFNEKKTKRTDIDLIFAFTQFVSKGNSNNK